MLYSSLKSYAYVALLSITIAYGANSLSDHRLDSSSGEEVAVGEVSMVDAVDAPGRLAEVSFVLRAEPQPVEAFLAGYPGRLSCATSDSKSWRCRPLTNVRLADGPALRVYARAPDQGH